MFYAFRLRRVRMAVTAAIVTVLLICVGFVFLNKMYPLKHLNLIIKYSEQNGLPPALVCAVIRAESSYRERAQSSKGARGLMQLTKRTADWMAEELKIQNYSFDRIYEPELNIQIGCYYLKMLIIQYNDTDTALAAYNAGSGNVSKWIDDSENADNLDFILFPETKKYVVRVNGYKKIYDGLLWIRGK